jgi:tetratricopeptide (TPR) repeat protein
MFIPCGARIAVAMFVPLLILPAVPGEDWGGAIVRSSELAAAQKCSEARTQLEAIPDSARDADDVRYAIAECYVKQAQWTQAESMLQLVAGRAPVYNRALFLRAYVLFEMRRYDRSLRVISDYLKQTPGNGEAHKLRGLDYFMLGNAEHAEQDMNRAVELNPSDTDAYYYLGRLYFTRKDMLAALKAFRRAIQLDPTSVKAYNQLGQTYEGLTDFEAAREAYAKAIELEQHEQQKSQWPYYNLGLLCLREGQSQQAIDYFRISELRNPKWAEVKLKLGMALLDAGRTAEAAAKLREAAALDPNKPDVHYQLGRVLSKIGEKEQARQHFLLFRKLGTQ